MTSEPLGGGTAEGGEVRSPGETLPVRRGRALLKKSRGKSLEKRHPWVFSGAVKEVEGEPRPGDVVEVLSRNGEFLAQASFSESSGLPLRVLSFRSDEEIDASWIDERVSRALARREGEGSDVSRACRLIHGESDGLPGVVVDEYGDFLSLQLHTPFAERMREPLVAALAAQRRPRGMIDRSDAEARSREGLAPAGGVVFGQAPEGDVIVELPAPSGSFVRSLRVAVDVESGQKTGAYLDQRENYWRVGRWCRGKRVLDCFSHTGGFGIAALLCGARTATAVDASEVALAQARRNAAQNDIGAAFETVEADVFEFLRRCRDARERYDVIVLDPPRFAFGKAKLDKACRAYKDINLLAMKLLTDGGVLATFSCSGLVNSELFQSVVFAASVDAGREARVVSKLSQPSDHPILLTFPESEYLKGLICRVE